MASVVVTFCLRQQKRKKMKRNAGKMLLSILRMLCGETDSKGRRKKKNIIRMEKYEFIFTNCRFLLTRYPDTRTCFHHDCICVCAVDIISREKQKGKKQMFHSIANNNIFIWPFVTFGSTILRYWSIYWGHESNIIFCCSKRKNCQ